MAEPSLVKPTIMRQCLFKVSVLRRITFGSYVKRHYILQILMLLVCYPALLSMFALWRVIIKGNFPCKYHIMKKARRYNTNVCYVNASDIFGRVVFLHFYYKDTVDRGLGE